MSMKGLKGFEKKQMEKMLVGQRERMERARLDQMNRLMNAVQGVMGNFAFDDAMILEVSLQLTCAIAVAMRMDADELATGMAKAFSSQRLQAAQREREANAQKAAENAAAILEGRAPPHELVGAEEPAAEEPQPEDAAGDGQLEDHQGEEAEQAPEDGEEQPAPAEPYADRSGCPRCSKPKFRVIHATPQDCPFYGASEEGGAGLVGPDGKPVA